LSDYGAAITNAFPPPTASEFEKASKESLKRLERAAIETALSSLHFAMKDAIAAGDLEFSCVIPYKIWYSSKDSIVRAITDAYPVSHGWQVRNYPVPGQLDSIICIAIKH
jgi:hypothetical protein